MVVWRKARKKPVVIEFREVEPREQVGMTTITSTDSILGVHSAASQAIMGESINTLEGTLIAVTERDYIIRGVQGELYPIKKTIFHETYDIINEAEP